ncbi:hypothetical protein LguiB_014770 [Lonicera macranthoides]
MRKDRRLDWCPRPNPCVGGHNNWYQRSMVNSHTYGTVPIARLGGVSKNSVEPKTPKLIEIGMSPEELEICNYVAKFFRSKASLLDVVKHDHCKMDESVMDTKELETHCKMDESVMDTKEIETRVSLAKFFRFKASSPFEVNCDSINKILGLLRP